MPVIFQAEHNGLQRDPSLTEDPGRIEQDQAPRDQGGGPQSRPGPPVCRFTVADTTAKSRPSIPSRTRCSWPLYQRTHQAQLRAGPLEDTAIPYPGPLPATASGRAFICHMPPQSNRQPPAEPLKRFTPLRLGKAPESAKASGYPSPALDTALTWSDSQTQWGTSPQRFCSAVSLGLVAATRPSL
jgi:hypothetical protein